MVDLIDRQAAIEWLKKVGRCWKCCEDTKLLRKMLGGIINHIEKMPVADAVEVVRCGTPCRWLYDEPGDYCCMNHKGLAQITPDSFCSYGRKAEENAAD